MKTIKIRQALLLTLTLFTALQAATMFGMEKQEKNLWRKNILFTALNFSKKKSALKKSKKEKINKIEQEENLEKNEKIEKIEKKENTKYFKYTASMAHLMTMAHPKKAVRPQKITLSPKPGNKQEEKTWLWSNGVLSKNKTEYTVHYNGVDYTSTYKPNLKGWRAPYEKQMDYFTYYDYLVDNNKWVMGKSGVEKENFMKYLIDTTMQAYPEIFRTVNENKIESKTNSKKNNWLMKTFIEIMLNEDSFGEKISFYTGYPAKFDFMYGFITSLHKYLDFNQEHLERSRFEDCKKYESSDEFCKENFIDIDDNDHEYSKNLLSTNICLFGNLECEGESTCRYFCSGTCQTMESKKCIDYVENLRKKLGLTLECEKQLTTLFNKYCELGGKLKHILIDLAYVDKLSYISQRSGYPYKQLKNDPLNEIFSGEEGKEPLTTKNVISLLRTDPNNKKLRTESLEHDKYLDNFQARFLHFFEAFTNPEKAKEYGLEIFYYFAQEGACEKQKELDKQIDALVKDMLWEALTNKTLTGGAELSKLVELYNAGKITKKEDLQIENLKKLVNEDLI